MSNKNYKMHNNISKTLIKIKMQTEHKYKLK